MPLSSALCLKDLAAPDARMALDVVRFAEKELERAGLSGLRGTRLLVALSGGADSTALLVLFCALRGHLGVEVYAAHLDHALRDESKAEAESARALCDSLGVPFLCRREEVKELAGQWRCGLEEAGRRARYAFLERCRAELDAAWVLTAHHAGDLAEDVLMRLSRGAGWPGLGGMRAVLTGSASSHSGCRILRPLLMQEKSALTAMLERLGVCWQEDASNQSRAWKRNRMRHDVLPLLLAENPSFLESVRRLWRSAREDESWWNARLSEALILEGESLRIIIPAQILEELGRAGRLRAMAEAVRRMECGQPRAAALEDMEAVWQARRFPRRFSFSSGLKAEVSAKGVCFFIAPGR